MTTTTRSPGPDSRIDTPVADRPARRMGPVARWGVAALLAGGLATSIVACSSSGTNNAAGPGSSVSVSTAASGATSAAANGGQAAAGSSTDSSSMAASDSMIMIQNYRFTTPITVSPGASVSVMNMDGENHTVTADSGKAFDVTAVAGKTVTFTAPTTPGSYPYHCTYHGQMHGVLVVR